MICRFLLLLLLMPLTLAAQKITVEEYIDTYKDIAMKEMKEYKIPASITLAQAIVESGAGNSTLAREARNHFGIKCHKGWEGDTFLLDDDAKDECFRVYDNVEESFRDHSLFLSTRARYASLFDLDILDYEGWAYGLKAAGYATSPTYAQALVARIETYHLDQYDKIALGLMEEEVGTDGEHGPNTDEPGNEMPGIELAYSPADRSVFELVDMTPNKRFIYENNKVRFIFAKEGETPESLCKELGIKLKNFCAYNLIQNPNEMTFHMGDVVYLESLRKRNWDAKNYVVAKGETLRDVALRFAVRPEKIIKKNKLKEPVHLKVGQKLKLR